MSSEIIIVEQKPVPMLSIRERVPNTQISSKMGEIYGQLWTFMEKNKIDVAGPPFAVYHDYDQETCDMECGFPTVRPMNGEGKIISSSVPGGKCVKAMHIGPYEKIMTTYEEIQNYLRGQKLTPKKVMWERYVNDPGTVKDPNQIITEIFWPFD